MIHHVIQHLQSLLLISRLLRNIDIVVHKLLTPRVHHGCATKSSETGSRTPTIYPSQLITLELLLLECHQLLLEQLILLRELQVLRNKAVFFRLEAGEVLLSLGIAFAVFDELLGHLGHGCILATC